MVQPRSVEGRMLNWQLLGAKGTPLFGLGRRVKQQSMLCTVNAYVCASGKIEAWTKLQVFYLRVLLFLLIHLRT